MFEVFAASFTGTAIEFFETTVIALALARAGYPREAITAVIVGHIMVFIAAIFLYPLHALIPIFWLRLLAALSLISMGSYWTIKSLGRLRAHRRPSWVDDPLRKVGVTEVTTSLRFSPLVFLVMMKSSVIEASEILIVVFPVAIAHHAVWTVLWGVIAAISSISVLALVLHGQLRNVPEVNLKLVTGLILFIIGASWLYEIWEMYAI